MKRRKVLALLGGAAVSPSIPARAAGEPKVFRLGTLSFTPPGPGIRALERQLQTLGWEEGRNLQIDFVQLDNTDVDDLSRWRRSWWVAGSTRSSPASLSLQSS